MLKNDIEKTLQAHSPVPPEGFAERMDRKVISLMQQKEQAPVKKKSRYRKPVIALAAALVLCFVTAASRDLIIRPDTIRARETATPLVTALSEGKGEETGAGTETLSAKALKMFETNFPGIAGELKPVNLSVEKQGIRMEVISALAKGNEAWIVYSLQDLEGDRVTRMINSDAGIVGIKDGLGFGCSLDYDEAEHKYTAAYYTGRFNSNLSEADSFPFSVEDVGACRQTELDLLPYLKEYGKASEGVKIPDDAFISTPSKVLDYTEPLNVSLGKGFCLTGIGWIDNQLHVQIREPQQERITIGSMTIPPMDHTVGARFVEGPEKAVTTERAIWGSADDGYEDMSEHIFNIRPEDADKIELKAWIFEITEVVKDTWEVQIPLADILLTAEEPAAREEETESGGNIEEEPQWKATLQAFFEDWALKDTDYLLNVCADAWKEGQADPEQAVKELVDARRPAGYRINGIAGQDGDPVRMLDVTVKWLGKDGGDTYTRHEVALRLQRVTWAMDAYRVDPGGFSAGEPAEPVQEREMVLLTEESILRNALRFYPELRDHPVPINLSVEKQGIRMEVVSGCLQENIASFLVKVRDVEGKYNGLDLQLVHIANNEGLLSFTSSERYRNKAENYSVWVYEMELPDPMPSESDSLNLYMNEFHAKREATIDLVPLLKEHAGTEDGVAPPEDARKDGVAPPEDARSLSDVVAPVTGDMKVLSYEASQEKIPLFGNIFLSGIGWIDGQLHVQLYAHPSALNKGYGISAYGAVDGKNVQADVGVITWDEWHEYVFNCDPDDVDRMTLETHLTEYEESLYDDWSVEIPMNMLLQKDAAESTAPAEPADREEEAELPADDWTAVLENMHPGLLKDLKPLNLRTIEQGIRMEVISALIRDQRLYVVYSAEDLEGGRLKADPVITLEPSLDYNTSSLIRLDYDTEKQKKVTCLKEFELVYPAEADQKIMLQFGGLGAREAKRVDLLPLLEKYGKDAAVTALPENTSLLAHDQLSISSADVLMYPEILDYTQPLEESMGGTLSLSGIGWIDNKLHVQFHDADPSSVRIDNTHYPSWSASAGAEIGDGDESRSVEYDKLSWKSAGEAKGEWDEYVLEISPDEAERMTLSAFVTHIEKILNVACRFELPAGLVMAEWPWDADPETAAPAA